MGAWIEINIAKSLYCSVFVAPLVGAWIEIYQPLPVRRYFLHVAPLVGAWIEMSRERSPIYQSAVAPLVGAWIEINLEWCTYQYNNSRSPRGSVD